MTNMKHLRLVCALVALFVCVIGQASAQGGMSGARLFVGTTPLNRLAVTGTFSSSFWIRGDGVLAAITEGDVSGLVGDLAAKEPALGNPSVSGYVLSSTTGGVRSWIPASGGGGSGTVNSGTSGQVAYYASGGSAVSGETQVTLGQLPALVSGVVSGCAVAYTGTNYIYSVGGGVVAIGGAYYTYPGGSVTLATADPSNPRTDLIVIDVSSGTATAAAITGTAAVNPIAPEPDSTQLQLTTVSVAASSTAPSGYTVTTVFDEGSGGEWNTFQYNPSGGGATFNAADTSGPFSGSTDTKATAAATNASVRYQASASASLAADQTLTLEVNTGGTAWASTRSLKIFYQLNGTRVGNNVYLHDGVFGFSSATSGYQKVSIPMSAFATGTGLVNEYKIVVDGTGGNLTFLIDAIEMQTPASTGGSGVGVGITDLGGDGDVQAHGTGAVSATVTGIQSTPIDVPTANGHVATYNSSTNTINWDAPAVGTVTSVTGTAPVVSSGGATPSISMAPATTSIDGYLLHTDWAIFNGKEPALGNPGTSGWVLSSTTGGVRSWIAPVTGGITQLTGDGTAGPGSGSQALTLSNTAVTAGSYGDGSHVPALTFDPKGRATNAVSTAIAIGASAIISGQLALARGGTGADLSATGGAGQYVKQATSGGAFTVGTIPVADVPGFGGVTVTGTPSTGQVPTATSSTAATWQTITSYPGSITGVTSLPTPGSGTDDAFYRLRTAGAVDRLYQGVQDGSINHVLVKVQNGLIYPGKPIFVTPGGLSSSPPPVVPVVISSLESGLIGAWLLNNAYSSSLTALDSSLLTPSTLNSNNGTITNSAGWVTEGSNLGPWIFSPNHLYQIAVPNASSLSPASCTVIVGIETTVGTGFIGRVVAKSTNDINESLPFMMDVNGGVPRFIVADGTHEPIVTSTTNVSDGAWHQVIGTRTHGSQLSIIVDGGTAVTTTDTASGTTTNSESLILGGQNGTSTDFFQGKIAYVLVWSRVLTSTELTTEEADPFAPWR